MANIEKPSSSSHADRQWRPISNTVILAFLKQLQETGADNSYLPNKQFFASRIRSKFKRYEMFSKTYICLGFLFIFLSCKCKDNRLYFMSSIDKSQVEVSIYNDLIFNKIPLPLGNHKTNLCAATGVVEETL